MQERVWAQAAKGAAPNDAICSVQGEEIEVLAIYLNQGTASQQVVVTQTEQRDIESFNLQLAAHGQGIPSEVRADFKEKNKSVCAIKPFMGIANLHFISRQRYDSMFRAGWSEFHKKYGKDAEILWFSRVGFNPDRTLALLHVSGGIDRMAGGGTLYLFQRKEGKWVIKSQIQTWAT